MFGKKKSDDVGHIKPSTQGTSNEISFSVLHAKSNAATQEEGSPARPMWELPQEELKARRTKRRRSRRLATAALVLGIVAIVVVVGSIVVVNVQRQLDHVAYMRSVLQQAMDECDQLKSFNESVSEALVQNMGSVPYADIESKYESAQKRVPQASARLRDLKSQIEDAQKYLTLPGDKEAANQGIAAINAQLNLLEMGEEDMQFALPAQKAYADAGKAVEDILRANDLAREATDLMANMNADSAAASKAKSEECLNVLRSARDELSSAQEEVGVLSSDPSQASVLATYLEYVNLRIEAQEAAISSMQAYIDRNKATLEQANSTYNQLESQAAALISGQQFLPADDVSAAFNTARGDMADQWSSELARNSVACSAVRDYLA